VPGVTDPYLREQLEKRRAVLKTAISSLPVVEAPRGAGWLSFSKKWIPPSREWTKERTEFATRATIPSKRNG